MADNRVRTAGGVALNQSEQARQGTREPEYVGAIPSASLDTSRSPRQTAPRGSGHAPVADPVRRLQAAAQLAGAYVAHRTAARVVILDDVGGTLLDVVVPSSELPEIHDQPAPGWEVMDRRATYDGALVPVAPSRLKLLKALVEAEEHLTASELTRLVFDQYTDESNTRYHLRELKKELAKAFPEFEGDMIQADNNGHWLVLR